MEGGGHRRGGLAALVRHPSGHLGAGIVLVFVVLAVLAPMVAPDDPLHITSDRLDGPSWAHLLGTDGLGRDTLSRLLMGRA